MRAVAVYAWARDPGAAQVMADGAVQWRSTRPVPGEDDHAVVAVALAVAGASGGEVVGLTLGDGDASWALARGVPAAVQVTDAPTLADESVTAAIMAAAVTRIGADVVMIGDAEEHPGVGVALAAHLGWPAVAGVHSATVEGGEIVAVRRVGDVDETVAVSPPVVLAIAAASAEPRAPGMKELLTARKRPVTRVALADLGVDVRDAVTSRGTRRPEVTAARLFDGDPGRAAADLVAALRAEGVL